AALASRSVPVTDQLENVVMDEKGARVAVAARGDIVTLPCSGGPAVAITRTPGAAEHEPAWSPDASRLAYFSDVSGEYQLCIAGGDGGSTPKTYAIEPLPTSYQGLSWSPDGQRLVFSDLRLRLWLFNVTTGTATIVDSSDYVAQGLFHTTWSPDGRWLAYA